MNAAIQPPWTDASAPIWALACGHASSNRARKPMAFLQAFSDDSASESGERRLFMAGYLGHAEDWARFSDAWKTQLDAHPPIEYLKMSEAINLEGEFRGWDERARDDKLRGFVRLLRELNPLSFEFSISREKCYRIIKPGGPRGLVNPHFLCCHGVVTSVSRFMESQGGTIPIDFIFDEQKGADDDIQLFFEQLIAAVPEASRKLIASTPVFRNDKLVLPLQAADMLATLIRFEHEHGKSGFEDVRNGRAHLMVDHSGEEAMLERWARFFAQQPGLSQLQSKSQWRRFKAVLRKSLAAGYIPPHGTKLRNFVLGWRDRMVSLFRR